MVQRYPSSSKPVDLQRPPAPPSVLTAVKLMYAGAAISVLSLAITLADIGGLNSAVKKARPTWTTAQVNQFDRQVITLAIVSGLLGIGLWLWMAWANKQGKGWARILSAVLFGLATLDLFGVLTQPKTLVGLLFPLLTWLVGLSAIFLLFRPDAGAFFKPGSGELVDPRGPGGRAGAPPKRR